MADSNQVGIYWGETKILFVGTNQGKATALFSIPIDPNDQNLVPGEGFTDAGNSLAASIQAAIKQHRIKAKEFHLALPTREIIFRSFVIPYMPSSEVKGAVVFEAGKYVPFNLDQLKYSYYPIQFNQGTTKKYRIIFVAIRRDTLEEYQKILTKAGLSINIIEPAQLSLARAFTSANLLPEGDVLAIVEHEDEYGKITVISDKIPIFVREFHLKINPSVADDAPLVDTDPNTKLINELRISLDYFSRQDRTFTVSRLILVSENMSNELIGGIKADLGMDVTSLSSKQVLGQAKADDINYLNAFGVSIVNSVNLEAELSFSGGRSRAKKTKSKASMEAKLPFSIKAILPTLLGCIALIGTIFFVTQKSVDSAQKKVDQIVKELDIFAEEDIETIDLRNSQLTTKQQYYDDIRISSDIAIFFTEVPMLLPEGAWFESMSVSYNDSDTKDKPVINMSGYVYHENVNEQFRLVYRLQKNLKDDKVLTEYFNTIDILTTESKNLQGFDVTYFKIKCE